jgi:hypothetical protein
MLKNKEVFSENSIFKTYIDLIRAETLLKQKNK